MLVSKHCKNVSRETFFLHKQWKFVLKCFTWNILKQNLVVYTCLHNILRHCFHIALCRQCRKTFLCRQKCFTEFLNKAISIINNMATNVAIDFNTVPNHAVIAHAVSDPARFHKLILRKSIFLNFSTNFINYFEN